MYGSWTPTWDNEMIVFSIYTRTIYAKLRRIYDNIHNGGDNQNNLKLCFQECVL